MTPVHSTAKYIVDLPIDSSLEIIHSNAIKCWQREFSFFGGDAFIVEKKVFTGDAAFVTVRRSAPDIGFQPAFMIVVVRKVHEKSEIEVNEGSCAYNCELNFTPDVKRWLNGDESCHDKKI